MPRYRKHYYRRRTYSTRQYVPETPLLWSRAADAVSPYLSYLGPIGTVASAGWTAYKIGKQLYEAANPDWWSSLYHDGTYDAYEGTPVPSGTYALEDPVSEDYWSKYGEGVQFHNGRYYRPLEYWDDS